MQPENDRGIPRLRLGDTFERFDLGLNATMREAYDRCRAVGGGSEWSALLAGEYGTGKTHLAIAALNAWMQEWRTGWFWKVPDFLQFVRETAFDDEQGVGVDGVLEPYRRGFFLLILDDLGAENPTDWANEQLYRVLDSRSDLQLPTIITTNRELSRIDGRILSRFREGLVICEGRDVRSRRRLETAGVGAGA